MQAAVLTSRTPVVDQDDRHGRDALAEMLRRTRAAWLAPNAMSVEGRAPAVKPPSDDGEELPWLFRSEAFAEDLQ